jgi:mannose/cellobiose epimerase-like protein (N-acyl-D-glucosamine 2-epimerase family)
MERLKTRILLHFEGFRGFEKAAKRALNLLSRRVLIWWPHDEALTATLMAYQISSNSKYISWHEALRDWSFKHFSYPVHGEWFGYLRRDGAPSNTLKGSLWKSFFHHPRALWRCHQLAADNQSHSNINPIQSL